MKQWTFRGRDYVMKMTGYGQYSLNGYHCTDSEIWDYVCDYDDDKKRGHARQLAENFVNRMKY